jgi:hypothetical protein
VGRSGCSKEAGCQPGCSGVMQGQDERVQRGVETSLGRARGKESHGKQPETSDEGRTHESELEMPE